MRIKREAHCFSIFFRGCNQFKSIHVGAKVNIFLRIDKRKLPEFVKFPFVVSFYAGENFKIPIHFSPMKHVVFTMQ